MEKSKMAVLSMNGKPICDARSLNAKRLMQLKTMKQMFRQLEPKVISTSQNKMSSA
jgi:hypothetical protein